MFIDCDCHCHSLSCHYDVTRGHGLCDNCTSSATANKCQFCEIYYWVNPWIDRGNESLEVGKYTSKSSICQENYFQGSVMQVVHVPVVVKYSCIYTYMQLHLLIHVVAFTYTCSCIYLYM